MIGTIRAFHVILCIGFLLFPLMLLPAADIDFASVCREKGAAAEARSELTVLGTGGWIFLSKELRHLGVGPFWGAQAQRTSRADKPERADPLPAILDFHQQLKTAGIRLIVLPVPAKAAIYPDKLDASVVPAPGLATADREFFGILRQEGVEVLDLTEDFLARREDQMFCKTDSHWSGLACVVAAQKLAEQLKSDLTWPRENFKMDTRSVTFTGDLVRARGETEILPLRFISTADGQLVKPSRTSPVILLGDSHCLVFHAGADMLAAGAGLADQLAMELGTAVDLIGVRGSGATPARLSLMRLARARPDYLKSKRVLIWCFTVREFTESDGWSKVPLSKPPAVTP
jgi:alginate O-acetyltransferase complex protein AlgJ